MNILIVDDEPMVARILSRLLEDHEVTTITDAEKALDEICENDFELIFCDLSMPVLSGDTLYRLAEERAPGSATKFVFMTGGVFTVEGQQFLKEIPNQVLHKPFETAKLDAIINSAKA